MSTGLSGAPEALLRDLRDRRLLPVALLLVVAIAAAPFLLKSDPPAGGGEAALALPDDGGAAAVDPVVLADPESLRDYRDRLSGLSSRNPFQQQLQPKGGSDSAAADEAAASGSASTVDSTLDSGTVDPVGSASDETVSDDTAPDDTAPDDGEPVPSDPDAEGGEEASETTLVTTRADVRIGTVGDTELIKDVKPLDFLPDRQGAVVEFLQGDFDLTSAVFVVSPLVTSSDGDGKCVPSPARCEFVRIEVGDEHSFQYDGERVRLKLLDVFLYSEPLPEDDDPSAAAGRERAFGSATASGRIVGG